MNKEIRELTLLLLKLISWEEKERGIKSIHSQKNYPFKLLTELVKEGYIEGSKKSKTVTMLEKGMKAAEELEKKYFK